MSNINMQNIIDKLRNSDPDDKVEFGDKDLKMALHEAMAIYMDKFYVNDLSTLIKANHPDTLDTIAMLSCFLIISTSRAMDNCPEFKELMKRVNEYGLGDGSSSKSIEALTLYLESVGILVKTGSKNEAAKVFTDRLNGENS